MEKKPLIDPTHFKRLAEDYITLVNSQLLGSGSVPTRLREKYTRLVNTVYKPQPPFKSDSMQ
ncbi:hypothetical protein BN8_01018 [Fibrisoma limi BUZ 3]|uniref:Uncharacterized protein n=1 Tax=Fibrisoma limi BUZ 3 TaxID=1185876 RepID=I2GDS1_9BACT|nr:hypothetical protein [Fibrisoma limi]CCH52045.1 hypothetical protein BN8_01018 [Fibrisoma limi BUZ 3]